MITVRQIARLWMAGAFDRLVAELLVARPEQSLRVQIELSGPTAAAAMALIRLDELSQAEAAICDQFVRRLLASQQEDGGWGDPMITALCLRALLCGRGAGLAIERGMLYLANMQKPEGIWPRVPVRRLPADPFVSAFILFELGGEQRFRSAVRFLDAVNWFEQNQYSLDDETLALWEHAAIRCRLHAAAPSLYN